MDIVIYILSTAIIAFTIGLALGMMIQWSKDYDDQEVDDIGFQQLSESIQEHS
jgi:hypothetical protein